jgi:hypothetical protein
LIPSTARGKKIIKNFFGVNADEQALENLGHNERITVCRKKTFLPKPTAM